VIETIHLEEEFETLMSASWVSGGMQLKIREIKDLLYQLPLSSSVSITSPDHLAKELFTYKGSGTLIRKGERVIVHDNLDSVNKKELGQGIASCFGRPLVADYFETKNFFKIYATDSYRGMAVLTKENDVPYMDKFAVTNQAQGEGLGSALWTRLLEENPKLFWRSRNKNPINNWYFQQAQGSYRDDTWTIFWVGLDDFDEIKKCIEHASHMPATLESHMITDQISVPPKEAP
jgi:acetylglutamate synthase